MCHNTITEMTGSAFLFELKMSASKLEEENKWPLD